MRIQWARDCPNRLVSFEMESATAIYVAVCDPEDSQGPFWGGSRLFQHRSFPLWKLCALAIQEAPLILLGPFSLSLSVCLSQTERTVRGEETIAPDKCLVYFVTLLCSNAYSPTNHDFRPMYLFQHGRVGTTPCSPSRP
jgi:hypothetical protein